jgi:hypothetical protein
MLKARSPPRALAKHRAISPPPLSRQGRLFPLYCGNPVISLCALRGGLLRGPVELSPIDPHAVQNDREHASDSDFGLAEPVALGESCCSMALRASSSGRTAATSSGRSSISSSARTAKTLNLARPMSAVAPSGTRQASSAWPVLLFNGLARLEQRPDRGHQLGTILD